MGRNWRMIKNPQDGDEVVFVGVHALRWKPEWGEPTVAFVREDECDAKTRAKEPAFEMKFGYLRHDESGHDYLVPEEEIEAFDKLQEMIYATPEEDWDPLISQFNDRYWKYSLGESPRDLRVVIPGKNGGEENAS